MDKIIPVILCGGEGSRLWPASRQNYPKQFLTINSNITLFEETMNRVKNDKFAKPVIITNIEYRFLIKKYLDNMSLEADIILEAEGKNTASAIAIAAIHISQNYGERVMLILPSDHIIKQENLLQYAIKNAKNIAVAGSIVTFGIVPEYGETNYGYIKRGQKLSHNSGYEVEKFIEKPNKYLAEKYAETKEYFWNSGIFIFSSSILLAEIARLEPEIYIYSNKAWENSKKENEYIYLCPKHSKNIPSISIDYAIMECTKNAVMIPLDCGWSDAGTWDILWRNTKRDKENNVFQGNIITKNVENCYLSSNDKLSIAALGLNNIIAVVEDDIILITHFDEIKNMPILLQEIAKKNKNLIKYSNKTHSPWGFYEILDSGEDYKVKKIVIMAGQRISLQKHQNHSENWNIASGKARSFIDGKEKYLSAGDTVFITANSLHYIENISIDKNLVFIETQYGIDLQEDDIERIEDIYGRQ